MVSKRNSVNCCREYFQEKNVNFQCIGFVCTHMPQGPLQESVLLFHNVCPRSQIQVLGLSGRGLKQLSHPNGPDIYFQGICLSV